MRDAYHAEPELVGADDEMDRLREAWLMGAHWRADPRSAMDIALRGR